MIYFLYGKDIFRLRERLKSFDNPIKTQDLKLALKNSSLFLEKESYLIEIDKDFELSQNLKTNNDIVFYYLNPDKRTKIFKKLSKIAQCEEFNLLEESELISWILNNYKISPSAARLASIYIGNDLYRVKNELNRVNSYIGYDKIISDKDINSLIKPRVSANIWNLKHGDIKVILECDDEFYSFGMMIWYFRNLIKIKTGETEDLHAFTIKKNQRIADHYGLEKLKFIYSQLLRIDYWLKIGLIERPATFFWLLYSF